MTYTPHDLDAERVVLSAVLCGEVTATELGLRASCFMAPLHKVTWGTMLVMEGMALENGCSSRTWAKLRTRLAWRDSPVIRFRWVARVVADHRPQRWRMTARELLEIRGLMHTAAAARTAVQRLRELDRQRQLIRAMQRIDAQLRTGVAPSSELVGWTMRRLDLLRAGRLPESPLEVRL